MSEQTVETDNLKIDPAPPLKPEDISLGAVGFTDSYDGKEILRIDKEGLHYKGCYIMDAGAAHQAWLAAMAEITPRISASEALFGFTAWLTTRQGSITLGAAHDCAPVAELLKLFLAENKLPEPRPLIYPNNFKMPKE